MNKKNNTKFLLSLKDCKQHKLVASRPSSHNAVVFCTFSPISSSATLPLQVWAAGAKGAWKQVPGTRRRGRGGKSDIREPHRCTSQSRCRGDVWEAGGVEEEEWERFGCTVQLHPASPVSPLVRDTGTSPAQAPRGPWHWETEKQRNRESSLHRWPWHRASRPDLWPCRHHHLRTAHQRPGHRRQVSSLHRGSVEQDNYEPII